MRLKSFDVFVNTLLMYFSNYSQFKSIDNSLYVFYVRDQLYLLVHLRNFTLRNPYVE